MADYEAKRGMVVEGAHAVDPLLKLAAKKGVELPVMQSVKALLDGATTIAEVSDVLMSRNLGVE